MNTSLPLSLSPRPEYTGAAMKQAIELLELEVIRAALRARVHTPLGEAEVNVLSPLPNVGAAEHHIEAVSQARALLNLAEPPPVWGAEDVEASLELGEKGIVLEGSALRAIARTMRAGSVLRQHLLAHEEVAPALYALAAGLQDLRKISNEVERCFDPDGNLADSASPELGPLRKRVRSLKESIHGKLDELLKVSSIAPYLQESYFTVRGDRYVLPIKSSFKNEVKGIVHDASGSGQTVYIEPQALVELGNRLKIAQSEQAEEELRILSVLTILVTKEAEEVRRMMQVIARCDALTACGRLANDLRCEPIVPDSSPGFTLKRARHPLLLLQAIAPEPVSDEEDAPLKAPDKPRFQVVGNDLALEEQHRVLVLTGPNTGGKTVAMKTIGLLALMVRCGLHLPCDEESRIGWYEQVDVAIGDQQSIASNLSTFAAHMTRLVEILENARSGHLVLIDEIASDTDPTQGQALAQAVLERLADSSAHIVVTTHFERLKAIPFVDERFRNAGVGFDSQRLVPTYHVTLDVPQGSSGFQIAQKLGVPEDLVNRAQSLMGDGSREVEGLLAEIERRSAALEQARIAAEEAKAAADAERTRMEEKQRQMDIEVERIKVAARKDLIEDIAASRDEVRKTIAQLQTIKSALPANMAMRAANQAADKLAKLEKKQAEEVAKATPEAPKKKLEGIQVGQWVHVPKLGRDGEVASIDGRDAQVVVGTMKVRVAVKSLRAPAGRRPSKKGPSKPPRSAPKMEKRKEDEEAPKEVHEELDLRGHTVDESIDRLEAFLDYHYGRPTTHVRVIHGHGTGALRTALREHLRRSGYVSDIRPGLRNEGGDGVTVVALA